MRAFDSRAASHGAPASKSKRPRARPDLVARAPTVSASEAPLVIQRKAACACGGGCPACREAERPRLQTKLQVSSPGDTYEREADQIAEQVLRTPSPCREDFGDARAGRGVSDGAGKRVRVSRLASAATPAPPHVAGAPPAVARVLDAAGEPLDSSARDFFEARFGHDFGSVRVHANREAADSAREISARAYTFGGHIVFGAGEYSPASEAGRRLLAHELAHTIQQGASAPHARAASDGAHAPAAFAPPRSRAPRLQRLSAPLIQRQPTDATVEAGTGVGPAIAVGWMATDPAIHNHTIVANNCFGRAGCNIRFHFDKAYRGDYNYAGGRGLRVRGVYVKISASYATNACGPCHELRLLQAVRQTRMNAGTMETAPPDSNIRQQRAGWGDPSAPSRGWMVDALDEVRNPYYSSSWVGQPGSSTSPARLWDTPGDFANVTNTGMDADTCLICSPASGASTVLACVRWGYYTNSSGVVAFRPAVPIASCGSTQPVADATRRWDAIPGNTPANVNFSRPPGRGGR